MGKRDVIHQRQTSESIESDKLNQFVETAGTTTISNNGGTQAAKYVVWKGMRRLM